MPTNYHLVEAAATLFPGPTYLHIWALHIILYIYIGVLHIILITYVCELKYPSTHYFHIMLHVSFTIPYMSVTPGKSEAARLPPEYKEIYFHIQSN